MFHQQCLNDLGLLVVRHLQQKIHESETILLMQNKTSTWTIIRAYQRGNFVIILFCYNYMLCPRIFVFIFVKFQGSKQRTFISKFVYHISSMKAILRILKSQKMLIPQFYLEVSSVKLTRENTSNLITIYFRQLLCRYCTLGTSINLSIRWFQKWFLGKLFKNIL